MTSQRKCSSCGKWTTSGDAYCSYCNTLLDPTQIKLEDQRNRQERVRQMRIQQAGAVERWLQKLQASDKKLDRYLYTVVHVTFQAYLAVLTFFIWLIALISS